MQKKDADSESDTDDAAHSVHFEDSNYLPIDMSTTESSIAGFRIDMLVDKPSFALTRPNLFTNC